MPHRKSLDLVESLLRLSEVGQYEQVKQLFSFPIKHCPDMLVLALLQISTSWHTLRHELISTLMPIFLGNHPNSAIILHYAWHGQVWSRLSSWFHFSSAYFAGISHCLVIRFEDLKYWKAWCALIFNNILASWIICNRSIIDGLRNCLFI